MDKIFPLEKNFCKIFKEKNNPERIKTLLPKYISSSISKWTLEFAKESYFKVRLCFLNNKTNHIFYFNYPNIEVIDDYGLLFLLKIYRLYEMLGMKIVDYGSKKDSVVIYNKNVDFDKLSRYLFILSNRDGQQYGLNFTKEDNLLLLSIFASTELYFEDKKAKENIFNQYLRESIMTDDFYKKVAGKKRSEIEKEVRKSFRELKSENKNFVRNTREIFDLQYENLLLKLNNFFKTEEFKKFKKSLKIKSFKYPMKKYFGKEHLLQYKFFKNLVDNFEKEVKHKLSNS